jgi:hypothetical protein
MLLSLAYDIVLVLTSIYVWRYGGRTGRIGVALFLSATALTIGAAVVGAQFFSVERLLLAADMVLFIGLVTLAMNSDRRWPIWLSAMQANTIAAHIVAMIAPVVVSKVYFAMATGWGLPMLLAMAGGTALDRRYERKERQLTEA